ncbi:Cyanate hydratase [Balamuthia mandrillaris]
MKRSNYVKALWSIAAVLAIGCAFFVSTSSASKIFSLDDLPTGTLRMLSMKQQLGLTWERLGKMLDKSDTWVAALVYNQLSANATTTMDLAKALHLQEDDEVLYQLNNFPLTRGLLSPEIPTDPTMYRFFEILHVYGLPLKDVIQEKFGKDGIMSAVSFQMKVERIEDKEASGEVELEGEGEQEGEGKKKKESRVRITYRGKYLPYRRW